MPLVAVCKKTLVQWYYQGQRKIEQRLKSNKCMLCLTAPVNNCRVVQLSASLRCLVLIAIEHTRAVQCACMQCNIPRIACLFMVLA